MEANSRRAVLPEKIGRKNAADLEKIAIFNVTAFSSKEHYFDSLGEPVWNYGVIF